MALAPDLNPVDGEGERPGLVISRVVCEGVVVVGVGDDMRRKRKGRKENDDAVMKRPLKGGILGVDHDTVA